MAQRLVRLNCAKCREEFTPDPDEVDMLQLSPEEKETAKFSHGKGCPECKGSGYKGRIGVFELILGTPDFRHAIATTSDARSLMAAARQQGYRTMLEDGKSKVLQGWTTPDEVLRAVYTQAIE
jgi:type II secretory ATPase GspE/PulE/Tfp pilus assembly ATPase PilB-like protein